VKYFRRREFEGCGLDMFFYLGKNKISKPKTKGNFFNKINCNLRQHPCWNISQFFLLNRNQSNFYLNPRFLPKNLETSFKNTFLFRETGSIHFARKWIYIYIKLRRQEYFYCSWSTEFMLIWYIESWTTTQNRILLQTYL
jgi:hypothetical protein